MKSILIGLAAVMLLVAAIAAGAQNERDIERQLRAAMDTEVLDRNPKAAIEQYKKVANSGIPRLEVQALLRMADCYRQLADSEEQRIYERIVRGYGNQPEAVAVAKARLQALGVGASPLTAPVLHTGLRLVAPNDSERYFKVTPDGRYVYGGDSGLLDVQSKHRRPFPDAFSEALDGLPIYPYADATALSGDGKTVAMGLDGYNGARPGELRTIPVDAPSGTRARLIFRNEEYRLVLPFGWSADDKHIYALLTRWDDTYLIGDIAVANGHLQPIKSLEWRWPARLSLSPDRRYIAYDVPRARDSTNRDIFVIAVDGSREQPIVEHPARDAEPVWLPDGKGVAFASDRDGTPGLWAVGVEDGRPFGAPERLKGGTGNTLLRPVGFARDGAFYYSTAPVSGAASIYTAEMDLASVTVSPSEVLNGREASGTPAYSRDGKKLAYFSLRRVRFLGGVSGTAPGPLTLVVRTLESGEEKEIPTAATRAAKLDWMPDGQSIVFSGEMDSDPNVISLHRIDVGTGNDLMTDALLSPVFAVSPDGKTIYRMRHVREPRRRASITAYDVATRHETELYSFDVHGRTIGIPGLEVSPDGRWILFMGSPTLDLAMRRGISQGILPGFVPVPPALIVSTGGGPPREAPIDVGRVVGWSADTNSALVYSNGDVWEMPLDGREPRSLGKFANRGASTVLIRPDGKQAVLVRRVAEAPGGSDNGLWADPDLLFTRPQIFLAQVDQRSSGVRGVAAPLAPGVIGQAFPRWSPDGKSIAFTRGRDLVVRSMSTDVERVYPGEGSTAEGMMSWFHLSNAILRANVERETGSVAFVRLDLESGKSVEISRLKADEPTLLVGARIALSQDDQAVYILASWIPAEARASGVMTALCQGQPPECAAEFTEALKSIPERGHVVVLELASGKERRRLLLPSSLPVKITAGAALELALDGVEVGLAVSPGGRTLALVTCGSGIPFSVATIGVDGTGHRVLYTDTSPFSESCISNPAWTPDGRGIVVAALRSEGTQLLRVPSNGGPPAPIGSGPIANSSPLRMFGGGLTRLLTGPAMAGPGPARSPVLGLDFSPDGLQIVYAGSSRLVGPTAASVP